jgi:hypothetical protein
VEQPIEFAGRELAASAIRNANSVSGRFELAGFGDSDRRVDSVRLVASAARAQLAEDFGFEFGSSNNASRHGISP